MLKTWNEKHVNLYSKKKKNFINTSVGQIYLCALTYYKKRNGFNAISNNFVRYFCLTFSFPIVTLIGFVFSFLSFKKAIYNFTHAHGKIIIIIIV